RPHRHDPLRAEGSRMPACRVPVPRGEAVAVRPRLGVLLPLHARARHAPRLPVVDLRRDRVPEGVSVGEPRRGDGIRLHERTARAANVAAVHRVPALPAPGTSKLPLVRGLPLLGTNTRTMLDVALYAALVVSLLRALVQPAIAASH